MSVAVLLSCSSGHLIEEKSLRESVAGDYRARSGIYAGVRGDLFGMADTVDDVSLREAVTFLLAYMPLSDLAVYEPAYLADNAAAALKARKEMPWGRSVPSELFLNFVLPSRVNNENPDDFRITCYDELKERVQGLTAMEAALEVNRWCQEKVAYQAADSRTSAPLATMLSARGRCGEESTFTVSALRTVAIPARQVYTPRWAHTDDNHAWVEFWVDGSWHYLGACEPEPVPDRGWFTEPARRAMLVHTKAFGIYGGDEEVISREPLFTEINTLNRYAETKKLRVRVSDRNGAPVPGAVTGYLLFNYAEFYPLARLTSDENGETSLVTGYGSLLIWADNGGEFGFSLAQPEDTVVNVSLTSEVPAGTLPVDLRVPEIPEPFPGIDSALAQMNNSLNRRGDSIRSAYISSWMAGVSTEEIAREAGLPAGAVAAALRNSMGNYREIIEFIGKSGDRSELALQILQNISDKDLRDTPADILNDHLINAPRPAPGSDTSLYNKYVLSPRISNEIISPFRSAFNSLPAELMESFGSDPAAAAAWTDSAVTLSPDENYYSVPLTPAGVLKLRIADARSRDIFFVALCRSAGIPARLAPGTGRPQYHSGGKWHDVWFSGEHKPSGTPGYIRFINGSAGQEPEYHVHFTLAHLENGRFITLDYGYGVKISDLQDLIALDPGTYMLTTGNRDEFGNVMASVSFYELKPGQELPLEVTLRRLPESGLTGEKIGLEQTFQAYSGEKTNLKSLAENGLVLIWMEPGREPTRHILNDLPGLKEEFDRWGGWFVFLTDPSRTPEGFNPASTAGIPENTVFAADGNLELMTSLLGSGSSSMPLPVVLCCNSKGEILFSSEGYRIGTGQQILKKIRQ
mgnify:FL=1